MKRLELSGGTIQYRDVGEGPVLVFLHGLMMDGTLWDEVVADLSVDHRCVVPTLPLGAHTVPFSHTVPFPQDTGLSLLGLASLVDEMLRRLELNAVTLIGSDTGGAVAQVVMTKYADRLAGAVLLSCDAFDNFPPGLTGRTLFLTARLPPALFGLAMQQMRLRAFRRLPITFGWLTKRGDEAVARWARPVRDKGVIRHETVRLLRALRHDSIVLAKAAEGLPGFEYPVLIVWAAEDRVMPLEHGRRLADLLPAGRLLQIPDSYTLVPLDQPVELASGIRQFVQATHIAPGSGS
jgi:pimeloyl-ACP methyl ester carboxylesterase